LGAYKHTRAQTHKHKHTNTNTQASIDTIILFQLRNYQMGLRDILSYSMKRHRIDMSLKFGAKKFFHRKLMKSFHRNLMKIFAQIVSGCEREQARVRRAGSEGRPGHHWTPVRIQQGRQPGRHDRLRNWKANQARR
jgi:hypothetical protein